MSDNEIVQEFLVESYENLDRLDRELVSLEKNPNDTGTLASIFRTIHTIKGTCGFLGFSKLEAVAHVGENLLSKLRDGVMHLTPVSTTALLSMVDAVRQMLSSIETNGEEGERDDAALIAQLTALVKSEQPAASSGTKVAGSADMATATPAAEIRSGGIPDSVGGADLPKIDVTQMGELLIEKTSASFSDVTSAVAKQAEGDPRHVGEILVEKGTVKSSDVVEALQAQQAARGHAGISESTIRVDVALLDKLMTLVGELVLARNQILQFSNVTEDAAIIAPTQRLNLITTELQEGVMKTRMQPIDNVWGKLPRTVRDLALSCGKELEIEMEGRETELDKTILEAIKDPLTHLVRNAVDHGIEKPEARSAAGKSPVGYLKLRAFHEGGQVNIEISDDGAGLDGEVLRRKAVEKRLITAEHAAKMSERDTANLIFLPGFSTAQKVTNVSGRGVGMDVVKTNIEKIGGTVDVESERGSGTTVKMKIPLTLAIVPGLVVTSAGRRFVVPQVSLIELVRVDRAQARSGIEMVHGVPVYRLRGRLLPLAYLDRELGLRDGEPTTAQFDTVNIVVLQSDGRQFGLIVDEIRDTEEIVVKPLGRRLKGVKIFAGATIMGDGKVAVILDVPGLAQRAGIISESHDQVFAAAKAASLEGKREMQTYLLFAGPDDARMAVLLGSLARLEEFPASEVEQSGVEWVVQYRGQILPLVRLSVALEERRRKRRHREPPASDSLHVLVCNYGDRSIGLVVEKILDIVDDRAEIQSGPTRAGILNTAVIGGRITELLDLPAVLQSAEVGVEPREERAKAIH